MNAKWTEEELATLRKYYPEHGPSWFRWRELLPGRTRDAIQLRASKDGCLQRKAGRSWRWTDLEDRLVLAAALRLSDETGRSVRAIGNRIQELARRAVERRRQQ